MVTNPLDNVFIVSVKRRFFLSESKLAVHFQESNSFLNKFSCLTSTSLMSLNHVRMKSVSQAVNFLFCFPFRWPRAGCAKFSCWMTESLSCWFRYEQLQYHQYSLTAMEVLWLKNRQPLTAPTKTRRVRPGTIVVYVIIGSFDCSTFHEHNTKSLHSSCPGSLRKEAIEGIISSNIWGTFSGEIVAVVCGMVTLCSELQAKLDWMWSFSSLSCCHTNSWTWFPHTSTSKRRSFLDWLF